MKKETVEIAIPKKSGGTRLIVSPSTALRVKLRRLLPTYNAASEHLCKYAYGFVSGRNVVTAAMKHRGFAYTLSCDLRDFFDRCTISAELLKHLNEQLPRQKFGRIGLPEYVAYKGRFAQGLPTSPALANLSAVPMDEDIAAWLQERDPSAVYTRYADDLSISSNNKDVLMELKAALPEMVAKHGHECHPRKWSIQSAKFGKRIICGVAIGDKEQPLTATRQQRRRLRAMQHKVELGVANNTTKRRARGLREWTRMRTPIRDIIRTRFRGLSEVPNALSDISFLLDASRRARRWTLRRVVERLPCRHVMRAYEAISSRGRLVGSGYVSSHDRLRFAFALVANFGSNWNTWLAACSHVTVSYHDACYWLPLRILPEDGFGEQLLRWTKANPDMPTRQQDLTIIAEAWLSLSAEDRKLPLRDLLAKARTAKYSNAVSAEFAQIAAKCGVAADVYMKYETKWLSAIQKAETETIPRGVVYEEGGYRGEMLLRENPEALWAGKLVNCCQYPGGGAGSSAWHAVTSNKGAIFAVYYNGGMIAQSWVWRKKDVLVFDNVEAISSGYAILPDIYAAAADWLIDKLGIREIRVGNHNDIPVSQWPKADRVIEPPKKCYSDAKTSQRILKVSAVQSVRKIDDSKVTRDPGVQDAVVTIL
jgi:RNA-directed DNA polymerase